LPGTNNLALANVKKFYNIGRSSKEKVTEDENMADNDEGEKRKRHGRKRKKKMFSEILQQMEFYFSDANIAKSSFMQVTVLLNGFLRRRRTL
jgi:hypothetical protein